MAGNKFSIEDAFGELDRILEQMEDPSLSLSDSMAYYKKGMKLLDKCGRALDKTEKEIQILQEEQNAGYDEGRASVENQKD
ncbi:MAG: exodeoxyribonuclease VII small subunit [Eubacterium sp.]|nr:exodeoxyribonuclease VII small subunit [Eubacterium sp.]